MRHSRTSMTGVLICVVLLACGKATDNEILERGKLLENNGEYVKAMTNYGILSKAYPESPLRAEAILREGLIAYYHQGDKETAQSCFSKGAAEYENSQIGQGCQRMQEFINSELAADSTETSYMVGLAYADILEDFSTGIAILKNVAERFPESSRAPAALFMAGFIAANSEKNYDEAKQLYTRFLKVYPDHEMAASVQWELKNLGKDINDLPEIDKITKNTEK
jgi:TolA-binding protein